MQPDEKGTSHVFLCDLSQEELIGRFGEVVREQSERAAAAAREEERAAIVAFVRRWAECCPRIICVHDLEELAGQIERGARVEDR